MKGAGDSGGVSSESLGKIPHQRVTRSAWNLPLWHGRANAARPEIAMQDIGIYPEWRNPERPERIFTRRSPPNLFRITVMAADARRFSPGFPDPKVCIGRAEPVLPPGDFANRTMA